MASAFALTPTASASAYESIVLARRREFGLSSEANSIEGRFYDEAESLALTSAPGEPGAEASDLADVSGSAAEGNSQWLRIRARLLRRRPRPKTHGFANRLTRSVSNDS